MGRKPDPRRKAELLSAFADYLLENGLANFSLRPAAHALGTSARVLLYHFVSKERLISAALEEVRRRQAGILADLGAREARRRPSSDREDELWRVWKWYTSPHMDAFLRLFFEVWGLALRDPKTYGPFLQSARTDLQSLLEYGLRSAGHSTRESRVLATLYLGAFRGLLLDFVTTGDRARIDAAVDHVSRDMQAALAGPRSSTRRHPRKVRRKRNPATRDA